MVLNDNNIINALTTFKNILLAKIKYYIKEHDVDPNAHSDIREAIENIDTSGISELDSRVSNLEDEWGEFYEDMAG